MTVGSVMCFREPQALETVAALLSPDLTTTSAASPLRAWVPSCSTGEEAYSLAICLWERFEAAYLQPHIRLFATDPDEAALAVARRGIYPQRIAAKLSARRVARFLERTEALDYRVCASLRERVLFGQHDVLRDPPIFTGLDLLCCRNLPPQLTPEAMSQLARRLHFALKEGGWLLLAKPLPAGPLESLFESASVDWPIYRARRREEPLELHPAEGRSTPLQRRLSQLEGQLRSANRKIASMATEIEETREDLHESSVRLKSLNEEIAVLNVELEHRARSLNAATDDLSNLIDATDIVVLFLDRDLRVRRFTASAARLLALANSDVGLPLKQIASTLVDTEFEQEVRRVLDTARPLERDLPAGERRWYLRRIRPYVAGGRAIGAVIAWIDITQIKSLQQEVASVAAVEQQRIGQELHDGIQQELAGLGLLAQTLCDILPARGEAARDLAQRLAQGIAAANERLHALARGLVPVPVDVESLAPALAELARGTREAFAVACLFEPSQVRIPDADTATHLYRIAQEAVRNATRHSNADRITIRLAAPDGGVMLEVSDNGIGLPPPGRIHQGVGLRLMEHRCSLIGGRFVAESQPAGGTRIACILPAQPDLPGP